MTIRVIGSRANWTRDCRPRWLLNELGIAYERVAIDLFNGAGRSDEHLRRHPLGKVPVVQFDDVSLWESGATVTYLLERFGDGRLAPAPDSPARALYHQWFFFAVTSVEPATTKLYGNLRFRAGQPDAADRIAAARKDLAKLRGVLEAALVPGPWILGEQFTAADIMLGSALHWGAMVDALDEMPTIKAYYARLAARPAFVTTFSEGDD